jgi:RimJ/RimL family protein N-acetyltransferase
LQNQEGNAVDIETSRLVLRPFREEDLDAWSSICSAPEVMRYASMAGAPLTREQSGVWLRSMQDHWQIHGYGMWAVEEKETGCLIGRVGLQYPPGFPETEVAWMLGTAHWGRGFAAEGACAAVEQGFSTVGRTKLISLIFPENARSIRLAERLGERYESDFHLAGHRLLLYSISREEWRAGRTSASS